MTDRIAVVAIWITDRVAVPAVNETLGKCQEIIRGRMGLPCREKQASIISLNVEGNTDQISALTGKLGMIQNVTVKSTYMTS